MYDGKQVLRIENSYKSKDLYNIGIEVDERKGTGNYEDERTIYNVDYVSISEKNLYQEVKKILKDRNIDYLHKDKITMLNGVIFTSGNEFFQTLGMPFKDSGRTYQTGDKQGQKIFIPDIRSKYDIPKKVSEYFDSCMEFLKKEVGEENIVLAKVHYDEDTPHLQAYFIPIVNEVQRKSYVKDDNGNVVKKKSTTKDGKETLTPKILRDKDNKIVYETFKGTFLNNDQFWKSRGGKNSFARLQDKFNEFINEKGFKLDRGNVGANIEHTTKLEHQAKELEAKLNNLKEEIDYSDKKLSSNKNTIKEIVDYKSTEELNPKKNKLIGYNSNDVEKVIEYSKQLEKLNTINQNELRNNKSEITKLKKENDSFKNNNELKKRDIIIENQKSTIADKNKEISKQKTLIESLEEKIENLETDFMIAIDKWKKRFKNLGKALCRVLGIGDREKLSEYDDLADEVLNTRKYDKNKDKDKSDDFEMRM